MRTIGNRDVGLKKFWVMTGAAALAWFLIRVIPKPSRAAYPCQRAAYPLASAFVLWLLSVGCSTVLWRKAKNFHRRGRRLLVPLCALFGIATALFGTLVSPEWLLRADERPFIPSDPPNQPVGIARGIHPGRVVWMHDPGAVTWNGRGTWWEDRYTDPSAVAAMLSRGLVALTGAPSDGAAWDMLFRDFNTRNGRGDAGYIQGEEIAIKLNLNSAKDHSDNENRYYTAPQVVLALLAQLVDGAGVRASDVTFYDATRYVPKTIFELCRDSYPGVRFEDWQGGDGREAVRRDPSVRVHWSEELVLEPGGGNPTYLPRCVTEAAYLINLAALKGHNLAGVTFAAKNHFGSIIADQSDGSPHSSAPMNAGVHPYICVHDDFHFSGHWNFDKRPMGSYNALVDLMGHAHLGAKTLLYLVDGLYSAPDQNSDLSTEYKWQSAPFDGHWPASLFLSQDGVALESVCLDFMRTEPTQIWVRGNVDNYLHEAALADEPPSGCRYDPEGDGSALTSLGVHEHWNNAVEKAYSRNLGRNEGIELVKGDAGTGVTRGIDGSPARPASIANYPNPFNNATTLVVDLARPVAIDLRVYSVTGRLVRTFTRGAPLCGRIHFSWSGDDERGRPLPSGLYLAVLRAGDQYEVQKLLLSR